MISKKDNLAHVLSSILNRGLLRRLTSFMELSLFRGVLKHFSRNSSSMFVPL